ncbi:hypothetical protein M405DRAFT_10559 [Rhizopogon salebrosus TDB-379]|nr:hypothetical protein M405DRAFT_10559 [Rhizopogon salebrosus TDB-379]
MCNDHCLIFIWQCPFLQLATLGPDWVLQYTRYSCWNPGTMTVACCCLFVSIVFCSARM